MPALVLILLHLPFGMLCFLRLFFAILAPPRLSGYGYLWRALIAQLQAFPRSAGFECERAVEISHRRAFIRRPLYVASCVLLRLCPILLYAARASPQWNLPALLTIGKFGLPGDAGVPSGMRKAQSPYFLSNLKRWPTVRGTTLDTGSFLVIAPGKAHPFMLFRIAYPHVFRTK